MGPQKVRQYIDAAPKEVRQRLRQMRACIRSAAPDAVEDIKWRMPTSSYRRFLVSFAAFKHHIGFYPTPSGVRAFAKELEGFATAKGSIRFPHDKALPLPLVRRITEFRVRESTEKDANRNTEGKNPKVRGRSARRGR